MQPTATTAVACYHSSIQYMSEFTANVLCLISYVGNRHIRLFQQIFSAHRLTNVRYMPVK